MKIQKYEPDNKFYKAFRSFENPNPAPKPRRYKHSIETWNSANPNANTRVIGLRKMANVRKNTVSSTYHPKIIASIEMGVKALELRKAGFDYQTIADQLGYTNSSAVRAAVAHTMARLLVEPVQQVRELELLRLDTMLSAIWQRVIDGDLKCIDRALHILDRRANLLGLNQIRQMDMTVWIRKEAELRGLDAVSIMSEVQALVNQLPAYVNEAGTEGEAMIMDRLDMDD